MHGRKPVEASLLFACLLLAAAPSHASVLTVGPGGAYVTIQAAIDAAVAAGGANDVRIAQGHWNERIVIPDGLGEHGSLTLTGGWGDGFATSSTDASLTVLDGDGTGPVADVVLRRGKLGLAGLTLAKGGRPAPGDAPQGTGGARVFAHGSAEIRIENVAFTANSVQASPITSAVGAGLHLYAGGDAVIGLQESRFEGNGAMAAPGAADAVLRGGGAFIRVAGRAHLRIASNRFERNVVVASLEARGTALDLSVDDSAGAEVLDNTFVGNGGGPDLARASTLSLDLRGAIAAGRLVARRNTLIGNQGAQVYIADRVGLLLSDSLIAGGDSYGVVAAPHDGCITRLTNLTVADNSASGVFAASREGKVVLANSIVFRNHPDLLGSVDQSDANMVGVEPLFVDTAHGNYRVQPRSPAIDAGDDLVAGGLGPRDLAGSDRIQGGAVDVGAFEGPPGCRVLWPFADPSTPACHCVSDAPLRNLRCAFFLPDVFLVSRVPLDRNPLDGLDWTIHPWTDVLGPYDLDTQALIGTDWVPQVRLGPVAPALEEGQLVVERFGLKLGQGTTLLRSSLVYHVRGRKDALRAEVELRLPD